MRLRVIDLETTGMEPPAEVIEFGFSDVMWDRAGFAISPPTAWLYRPLNGIPPETMAVHHLTEADFGPETFPSTPDNMRAAIAFSGVPDVLVAHNCDFERSFLPADVTGANQLYIYKEKLRDGTVAEVLSHLEQIILSHEGSKQQALALKAVIAKVDALLESIAARIKDPHPFLETVREALPDLFRR